MYLTTINIIGVDYKVYGMTLEEYNKHNKTLEDTVGTTDKINKNIYLSRQGWKTHEGLEFAWDAIETTIIHEIGHAIEEEFSIGNVQDGEYFSNHSEMIWKYGKKYIPIIKKAWYSKPKLYKDIKGGK